MYLLIGCSYKINDPRQIMINCVFADLWSQDFCANCLMLGAVRLVRYAMLISAILRMPT